MKTSLITATLVASLCLSSAALAQDEEQTYLYATYYYCDGSQQDRIDEIIESSAKPIYDAAVKAGEINSWGWLVHHTGGKWRRILYHGAGSMDDLLATQDALLDKMEAQHGEAMQEFGRLCNSHDDYIWRGITGSGGDILSTERGKVGLSAYYVCDSREPVADEIVKTVFAPQFDAQVSNGKLTSWGWSEHIIGGKYRRLSTLTAADWPSLFAAREELVEAGGDSPLAGQFGEICDSHVDYMWEIRHESP